jgi:hypothetical protein
MPLFPTAKISSSYDNNFTTSLIGEPSYFNSLKSKLISVTLASHLKFTPFSTK